MPLKRGPKDVAYTTVVTGAEYKSEIGSTEDTPYLALTGELWCVFCENVRLSWPYAVFSYRLVVVLPNPLKPGVNSRMKM